MILVEVKAVWCWGSQVTSLFMLYVVGEEIQLL